VRSPLIYRRRASPLHAVRPSVALAWAGALLVAIALAGHPLVLGALALALLVAGAGAAVGEGVRRAFRLGALAAVPIVIVNVLVSRQGLTVFARVGDLGPFGQGDLTVEAAVYGCVVALRFVLLVVLAALVSLAIDPDGVLRLVRRLSYRSAVTASLATRLIPVIAGDARRLAEAQRTRPDGGARGARARVAIAHAVVAGSLDRALDVAATLELRGFAHASRAPRASRPWCRHDVSFLLSAFAIVTLAVLAGPAGGADFAAYPQLHAALGLGAFAIAAGLLLAAVLPFCDRRGIAP
jgi:energy-coupling factor transport system permease protein